MSRSSSIRVFAPATVANLGSGFDVLGLALEEPGDELLLYPNELGQIRIREIEGDEGKLSRNPAENTSSVAIIHYLRERQLEQGFDLVLHKKMPLGSGLGSSAASAVAGVFAVDQFFGGTTPRKDLLLSAMEGERIACGAAHADNVGPSLLGGIVLISSYEPLRVHTLPSPEGLILVVVHPHVEVRTADSRAVLAQQLPLSTAVSQWAGLAGLVSGLYEGDFARIAHGITDYLAEPARSPLIPGFANVKAAAIKAGALNASISGSGPSVFAACGPGSDPDRVAAAMVDAFRAVGLSSSFFISTVNRVGARVLD